MQNQRSGSNPSYVLEIRTSQTVIQVQNSIILRHSSIILRHLALDPLDFRRPCGFCSNVWKFAREVARMIVGQLGSRFVNIGTSAHQLNRPFLFQFNNPCSRAFAECREKMPFQRP